MITLLYLLCLKTGRPWRSPSSLCAIIRTSGGPKTSCASQRAPQQLIRHRPAMITGTARHVVDC
eukprot:12205315-Alexandrium_andersonii.AAC.1